MDRSRGCGHVTRGPGVSILRRLDRRSSCVLPLHWSAGLLVFQEAFRQERDSMERLATLQLQENSPAPRTPAYWITRPASRGKTGSTGSSQRGCSSSEERTSSRVRCLTFGAVAKTGLSGRKRPFDMKDNVGGITHTAARRLFAPRISQASVANLQCLCSLQRRCVQS
jgi:hypothetical protein